MITPKALVETLHGTRWSLVRTPYVRPAGLNELYGISCPASGYCAAVGLTGNGQDTRRRPLAEQGPG
jgi:hypothetical protein